MKYSSSHIAKGFIKRLEVTDSKKAVKELASLILEKGLHSKLDNILEAISKEYFKKYGVVEAEAITAFSLNNQLKNQITGIVKSKTKAKKVILSQKIDKSLLGGVIINAPNIELDLSLKTKLNRLKA